MKEQSYRSHSRYVYLYHFVTLPLIVAVIVGSIVNLVHSSSENLYSASLIAVLSLVVASVTWYARQFSIRAQDRAIRAEESLRYFILSGSALDKRISMRQIIALRFAGDEEFPALCREAAEKGLSPRDIKKSIKNWRADHHRA